MSLQLCLTLCDPSACSLQAPLSVEFPGKNSGVGCHFLLQGIFSTQGLNLCLLPCRWILSCWATKNAHKDYRWNITFKNCEALYCTPVTYIILCINYASKKKWNQTKNSRQNHLWERSWVVVTGTCDWLKANLYPALLCIFLSFARIECKTPKSSDFVYYSLHLLFQYLTL